MKQILLALSTLVAMELSAQTALSPETLWSLGKVSGLGISKDKQQVLFSVNFPDVEANKGNVKTFRIGINGGNAELVTNPDIFLTNTKLSPDGNWLLSNDAVKIKPVFGTDFYVLKKDGETETIECYIPQHIQQPMIEWVVEYFTNKRDNPCSADVGIEVMQILDAFDGK